MKKGLLVVLLICIVVSVFGQTSNRIIPESDYYKEAVKDDAAFKAGLIVMLFMIFIHLVIASHAGIDFYK